MFNLERVRGINKQWQSIKCDDGSYSSNINTILKEQVKFYEQLFMTEGWDKAEAENLINNINCKISSDEKKSCEKHPTETEIHKAVTSLKHNKSPGSDGILGEFYQIYWNIIKIELKQVLTDIFLSKEMSTSQYRGIITLQYKQGEREDLANWRPITLLNTDYKIITKILTGRLKPILPNIIHSDQRGFIKDRNIEESIRLLSDVIEYTDKENKGGAIIFLDQQKAFDRVEWGWLETCLDKFGFGKNMIEWIQMTYKYSKSCVLTNGYLSKFFSLSRSVKQGCPIAPLLYIIQAEALACSIRNSNSIIGINLPVVNNTPIQVKISMFADDSQLFVSQENSLPIIFDYLSKYEKASGAKVNMKKTKGLYIGTWKQRPPNFRQITWVKDNIKALGVYHGYNIDQSKIWETKITKN